MTARASKKPLPFRGGVGVAPVSAEKDLTSPTPGPSPERERGR
jgi:hypothetical protein